MSVSVTLQFIPLKQSLTESRESPSDLPFSASTAVALWVSVRPGLAFYVNARDGNSGSHACQANILTLKAISAAPAIRFSGIEAFFGGHLRLQSAPQTQVSLQRQGVDRQQASRKMETGSFPKDPSRG